MATFSGSSSVKPYGRARDEGVLGAQVLVDGAGRRAQSLGRRLSHDGEGLVEPDRRGRRPAYPEERLQRAVLLVEGLEEVGVADGDGGQHGHLREELLLVVAEAPAGTRLDEAQHTDDLAVELERRVEGRLLAPAVHLAGLGRGQAGIVAMDLDHLALVDGGQEAGPQVGVEGLAGDLLADLVVRFADPRPVAAVELEIPEGKIREEVVLGVVAMDVARVHAEGLTHLAGDLGHDVADLERRRDGRADLGDDRLAVFHACTTSSTFRPHLVPSVAKSPWQRCPTREGIGVRNGGLDKKPGSRQLSARSSAKSRARRAGRWPSGKLGAMVDGGTS